MVFSILLRSFLLACGFERVAASPVSFEGLSSQARGILERANPEAQLAPAAPHFVVYADQYVSGVNGPPPASAIKGYNVFALSFLLLAGPWDKAYEWTTLTTAQRSAVKSEYAAAGISLIVSCFGSTDVPTTTRADPIATADKFAAWVIQYNLDGIDVDYEDFGAMDTGNGAVCYQTWLISFTRQLRARLPPFVFTPNLYSGGGYLAVHSAVGSLIDWYNLQFYNQGSSEYTTCNGLLTSSSSTWPETALFQIANNGVPLSKLVIGKPATASDASNGYMSPSTLATCVQTAKNRGWNGGVMVWQYPRASEAWIATVRSLSWPV